MKEMENVSIYFHKFFERPLIKGGENEFIQKNRFLLFDVPQSLLNSKEYTLKNLRSMPVFQASQGPIANAYFEEYYQKAYDEINEYNDYDYLLDKLYSKRNNFDLASLSHAASLFSTRVKNTEKWKTLSSYIANQKLLIDPGIIPPLTVSSFETLLPVPIASIIDSTEFVFIDFWASWCVPCIEELPKLKDLYQKLNTKRIKFVSISVDDTESKWINAINKYKTPWPAYRDIDKKIDTALSITYIPQGLLVSGSGKIIERYVSRADLIKFISVKELYKEKFRKDFKDPSK